jgi:flagellar biosynthesis protein FlhB
MSSSEEKTEEATAHKLSEARKRGEVAVSKDLTGAITFAAVFLLLWLSSDFAEKHLRNMMGTALDVISTPGSARALGQGIADMLISALWVVGPALLLGMVASLVAGLLQTKGAFSTDPLKISFDRLNPVETIKQLFSTKQLGVFVLLLLKVGLLGALLVWTFRSFIGPMISSLEQSSGNVGSVGFSALRTLFGGAALVFVLLSLVDYLQQYFEYLKRNRMSKTERKQESKDQDGDPHMKSEQRSFRRELTESQAKPGMSKAQVLVTNPTHFAVALYYEPGMVELPVVVAKGEDATTLAMRSEATTRAIPIMENPALARALHRSVSVGEYIGDEHLEAVAEVFRWIKRLKGNTGSTGTRSTSPR